MKKATRRRRMSLVYLGRLFVVALTVIAIREAYVVGHNQHRRAAQLSQSTPTPIPSMSPAATPTPTPSPATNRLTSCTRDQTMYVSTPDGLRLRANKSDTSGIMAAIPYQAAVQVGCLENGKYSAEYAGRTGYVSANYLEPTAKP